jgi:hypothetical protein
MTENTTLKIYASHVPILPDNRRYLVRDRKVLITKILAKADCPGHDHKD